MKQAVNVNVKLSIGMDQCNSVQFKLGKTTIAHAISALFAVGIASTAFAQGAPAAAETEEIIITGTLIRGVTPTGSPVIGLSAKDIQEQGFFNATDVLRSIPQILNLGATDSQTITAGSNTASNQTGSNGVNLRGLGTSSTLTLINGHRSAPGGTLAQVFDASTLPSLAINRLEVVIDGASSLYGSDAVAGVVNMRLKKVVDAATAQFSVGSTNDIRQWSASVQGGKSWETGNVTATFERTFRSELSATKRSRFYDSNPYNYGLAAPNSYGGFFNSPANILVTTSGAWGTCSTAAPCFFAVPNQNGANLTGASLPTAAASFANSYAGANIRNVYNNVSLLPEQKRDTLVLIGDQQLSKSVRVSAEVLSTNRSFKRFVPAPTTTFLIPNSNPFSPCNLTKTNRPAWCGALATSTISVPYIFDREIPKSPNIGTSKLTNATLGFDIDLWGDWAANLSGTYSRNVDDRKTFSTQLNNNTANPDRLTTPAFLNAFNPFIGDGTTSATNQDLVNKLIADGDVKIDYVLKNYAARFDGSLFDWASGTVKMATGLEYRTDKFTRSNIANNATISTSIIDTTSPASKQRTVNSAYVELFVPLVGKANSLPLMQEVNLSLASRYENNNAYGSSRTPKFGLTWVMVDGFQLNATYGKSFRAPALPEADTFQGTTTSFSTTGQLNFSGTALSTQQAVITVGGGNPDLKPETATTKTFGFVWKPSAISGLEAGIDYYDIKYVDRISGNSFLSGVNNVLSNPVFSALILAGSPTQSASAADVAKWLAYISANTNGFNSLPTCQGNTALPATPCDVIAIIDGRLLNTGVLTTNGIDANVRYTWTTSLGRWNAGLNANLVNSWKVARTPSAPLVESVNHNDDTYPIRVRARALLGWADGPYRLGTNFAYTGSYTNTNRVALPGIAPTADQLPANEGIGSSTIVGLNASYDFGKQGTGMLQNLRFQLNVSNLFDRDPPYARFMTVPYVKFDPQNASAIGRQITLQMSKDW